MRSKYYVYRTADKLKVTKIYVSQDTLDAYGVALSNFGCRPVVRTVLLGEFENHYRAKEFVRFNSKDILSTETPMIEGNDMEPRPYEGYDPMYKLKCPTCGSEGLSNTWKYMHLPVCKFESKNKEDVI